MMKRKLEIFQYGSELDQTLPTRYSPSDWIEISISESSPYEYETSCCCSIGAPEVSNNSASTGVRNELGSSSPQDLSDHFTNISRFFQGKIEEMGADLPSNWSPEELTRLVIGEEEVLNPSYLADVYSNLLECGFYSSSWEKAFDYFKLIYGFL